MKRAEPLSWSRHRLAQDNKESFARYIEPELRPILDSLQASGIKQGRFGSIILRSWAENTWAGLPRQVSDSEAEFQGFLIPQYFDIGRSRVFVNGKRVEDLQIGIPNDIGVSVFPESGINLGISFTIPDLNIRDNDKKIEFSFWGGNSWEKPNPLQSIWIGPSWGDYPDAENLIRIGNSADSLDPYIAYGATFIYKLEFILKSIGFDGFKAMGQILDWGCGCSRMIRFIEPDLRHNVIGIDIDPMNIEWNQQHMPGAHFAHIPVDGPTPFVDGQFGLVYGNSVFTHLNEEDQFYWLQELARITRAGGIVAVTVHANMSWVLNGWYEMETLYQRFMDGIVVSEHLNDDIGDVAGSRYTDTNHTHSYILDKWSKAFEVISIIENFSGPQALVVLRRRTAEQEASDRERRAREG